MKTSRVPNYGGVAITALGETLQLLQPRDAAIVVWLNLQTRPPKRVT